MKKNELKQDMIFDTLLKRIVELEYKPGEILSEVEIANELGVSRTPVRNVFKNLEFLGLLDIVPRYGVQVPQIDLVGMKSLFEISKVLDPMAVELAIDNLTDEQVKELFEIVDRQKNYDLTVDSKKAVEDDERFHQIIIEATDNVWLEIILTRLHYHSTRLWHYCNKNFESPEIFHTTLKKIAVAIREKDKQAASIAAREHIEEFVDKIKNMLL